MDCRILFIVILGWSVFSTNSILAEDWFQWRGPQRNGKIASSAKFTSETKFEEQWQAEVGIGFSSIVVVDERVLTMGNQDNEDTIWCLNAADGTVLWKQTYSAPLDPNLFEGGPTATPTVVNGRVFTISRAGEIYCLNLADGAIVWHVQVPEAQLANIPSWGFSSSPLIREGHVYLNVGSHGLCLDAETGDVIWESDDSELPGYTSPLLMESEAGNWVLLVSEKTLNAVDPATGEVVWSHPWITRYGINAADPLIQDAQHLILTSGYGKGCCRLKIETNSEQDTTVAQVWRSRNLRDQMSPGVLINGFVYATDGDAGRDPKFVCVDPETGNLGWMHRGFGSASLIAVGDQILLLSDSGTLVVIDSDPKSLKIVAEHAILSGKCWTPPTYSDSRVLARNAVGHLVCVKVSP